MRISKEHNSNSKIRINSFIRISIYVYFGIAFIENYTIGIFGHMTRYYLLYLSFTLFFLVKSFNIKRYQFIYILWLLYYFITLLWTKNLHIFNVNNFTYLGMISLLLIFSSMKFNKKTITGIINTVWYSSGILGFLSLFFNTTYRGSSDRIVLYLFDSVLDPNNQAALVLIGISISLYNLVMKRKLIVSFLILIITIISLMLTGSRGGFIALIIIGLFSIIIYFRENYYKNIIKKSIIMVLLFLIVFIVIKDFLPQNIMERIFNLDSYEDGSGRISIWKNTMILLSQKTNLLFGAGWGSYWGFNGYYSAIHNTFLAMIADVGILGFSLFFIPIITFSIRSFKKGDYLSILILLSGFIPSLFIDALNKRFFWNSIFIFLILYNYNIEDNRQPKIIK